MVSYQVDPYVPAGGDWGAQNFVALRDECLKNRQLFEDPTFPALDQSLFFSQAPPKQVEWLRPGVKLLVLLLSYCKFSHYCPTGNLS